MVRSVDILPCSVQGLIGPLLVDCHIAMSASIQVGIVTDTATKNIGTARAHQKSGAGDMAFVTSLVAAWPDNDIVAGSPEV